MPNEAHSLCAKTPIHCAKRGPFVVRKEAHILKKRPMHCAQKDTFFARKEVNLMREKRPINYAKRVLPLMVRKEANLLHLWCEKSSIDCAKRGLHVKNGRRLGSKVHVLVRQFVAHSRFPKEA